ncbi:MAG: hypothetical protein KGY70_07975 [Bacteroidales bacterium]|nr:hypothetical protein [Bacteroidales bacterium]
MKIFRNILLMATMALVIVACDRGIDPISKVEPGPDEEPPVVNLNYPTDGTAIRVKEDITSIDIKFEVRDDIEIQSIVIELNGSQIAELTEFKDYRRVVETVTYDQVTNGEHTLTLTATDMSGKSTSKSVDFEKIAPYETQYDGEIFYMPFDASFMELVSITNATEEGSPGFAEGKTNQAYAPAPDSYVTFPTATFAAGDALTTDEFSATFWYNMNTSKTRAGILVIGPPGDNDRTNGFRLFREGDETNQNVTLNVGNGDSDSWFGGPSLSSDAGWVHVAVTISSDQAAVYFDGNVEVEGDFPGPIGWEGCDILSIGSGAPRFIGWNHLSDVGSLYDELRIYNKALSQEEIQTIMDETKK